MSAWWERTPLLVSLLGWLAAGIVGGIGYRLTLHFYPELLWPWLVDLGFGVWGIGFLALVGFGYYARVRHVKFGVKYDAIRMKWGEEER